MAAKNHSGSNNSSTKRTDVDYRSAKTGQYVTARFAKHHPATTVRETGRKK